MPGWNLNRYLMAIGLAVLLATLLIWFSHWRIDRLEQKMQHALMHELAEFLEAVDKRKVRSLHFTTIDTLSPVYQRLYRQLRLYQQQSHNKGFYGILPLGDSFVLGMNYNPHSALRAGDTYPDNHKALHNAMHSQLPSVVIPGKKESTEPISVYVPLYDPATAEAVMLVGMQTPSDNYFKKINRSRLLNYGGSLLFLLLLLALLFAIYMRDQSDQHIRYKYRHIETLLVTLSGLIITLAAYVNMKQLNQEDRQGQFTNHAAMHARSVRMGFNEIRDNINTLSNYFSNSDFVDQYEYSSFTATFSEHDAAIAYGFAPLLYKPLNTANPYAADVIKLTGVEDDYASLTFAELHQSLDSKTMMAPVLYLSHDVDDFAYANDLMRQPVLHRAMELAIREGMPSATSLLPDEVAGWTEELIFVFNPVYTKNYENPEREMTMEDLYGFTFSILDARHCLDASINQLRWTKDQAVAGLTDLMPDGRQRLLALFPGNHHCIETPDLCLEYISGAKKHAMYPVFVFGRSYAFLFSQEEGLKGDTKTINLWFIVLGGLMITALMALLLWFQRNRWSRLQNIIDRKTADLNQRIRELHALQQLNVEMQKAKSPEDLCQATVQQMAVAFSNGGEISTILEFDGRRHSAGNKLSAPISGIKSEFVILGGRHGFLEVTSADEHTFKANDQQLLDQLALALGRWFERYFMESALRQSEERFRQLVENAFDAIYLMEGRHYNYVNERFEQLTGYSSEELTKPDFNYETLLTERSRIILEQRYAAREKGEALKPQYETQLLTKTGQVRDVEVSTVSVGEKNKVMVMGIMRDITERKKSQQDILKRDKALQQKNKELLVAKEMAEAGDKLKTAFLNNISHEVRTPLNGILGAAALMSDPNATPQERTEMTEIISVATQRLLRTITQYMDISLLSSNNMAVYKEDVKLKTLIDPLLGEFDAACRQKDINFVRDLSDNLESCTIETDKSLLMKVLHHLLDNAVKFTKNGKVVFGCRCEKTEIAFYVSDTGIGIDPAAQARVFTEFMQEDSSNVRRYEGSGLGLAICKHIIDLLGGRIWFETEKNKGSVFHFVIPTTGIKLSEQKEKPIQALPSEKEQQPLILFAEDEDSNYQVLNLILRKKTNARVLRAENGQEAVDYCRQNPEIELVLMDIKMPVMDGYEATRQIKAMRPELPVVAITAYGLSGDEHKSLQAGCDDYMAKPVKKEDLLAMVKKYGVELK